VRDPGKPIVKYLVRAGELAVKKLETNNSKGQLKGLAATHLEIITYLLRKGPASMQSLSQALERDKSTITVLVRKLVAAGLVTRKAMPGDARVVIISLTAKGAALRTPILRTFLKTERALVSRLTAGEEQQLFFLLEKVYTGLAAQKR